jgi:hypothetical protein
MDIDTLIVSLYDYCQSSIQKRRACRELCEEHPCIDVELIE